MSYPLLEMKNHVKQISSRHACPGGIVSAIFTAVAWREFQESRQL